MHLLKAIWTVADKTSSTLGILGLLGFTVTASSLVGWWAAAAESGIVIGIITGVLILTCTLICWVAILWMKDRADRRDPNKQMQLIDSSWALRIDAVYVNYDPHNKDIEWQVVLQVRNMRSFPIKAEIMLRGLEINNRTPDAPLTASRFPIIIDAGQPTGIVYDGYAPGSLPDADQLHGKIDFECRYGHADGPYTRHALRRMQFIAAIKGSPAPGLPVVRVIKPGQPMPAQLGPREAEIDEPYVEK